MADLPIILAHRGNLTGPSVLENTLSSLRAAFSRGWGVETDIRRSSRGAFYISHDRRVMTAAVSADAFCSLFRQFPDRRVALNIKEGGHEDELVEYLTAQSVIDQILLFDMELVEDVPGQSASRFRQLHPTVRLAARVSDRDEPLVRALEADAASVVWIDEFDHAWCTEADILQLKHAGRTVYAVSPELHGATLQTASARWTDFLRWGVDGICTDYPSALNAMLMRAHQDTAA